jgi:hypothetical protein
MACLLACTIFDPGRYPSNHLRTSGSIACLVGTGAPLAYPDAFEVPNRPYNWPTYVDRLADYLSSEVPSSLVVVLPNTHASYCALSDRTLRRRLLETWARPRS